MNFCAFCSKTAIHKRQHPSRHIGQTALRLTPYPAPHPLSPPYLLPTALIFGHSARPLAFPAAKACFSGNKKAKKGFALLSNNKYYYLLKMMETAKKQVKRRTDEVADYIGRDIVAGRLEAGQPLPSDDALCAQYQISRTILREALRILGAKGLIAARPKAGTFVCPRQQWALFDADLLDWINRETPPEKRLVLAHQLLDLRLMIEPGASALASSRATQAERQDISNHFAGLRHSTIGASMAAAELRFFICLYQASHNAFISPLQHICRLTHDLLEKIGHRYTRDFDVSLHERLTRTILNHDAIASRATTQALLLDMYVKTGHE